MQRTSDRRKAAILMVSIGPELSARVLKHLSSEDIEDLTLEIASVGRVTERERETVLSEFGDTILASDYISKGGIEYAREILERALGTQRAVDIINRLTSTLQVRPFDFVRRTSPQQLLDTIANEHVQTIALVVSYLDPDKAAAVLSALPRERQAEVAKRIALMDRASPEVIKQVESVLEKKLSSFLNEEYSQTGGIDSVVGILNKVDRGTEKQILESLELDDPELAEEIRQKMFVFEDIVKLDDRSMQRVIQEISNQEIALALKAASDSVKRRVFSNMSKRMAEIIQEDMEYMGPVRIRDVENAQQRIVGVVRRLEDTGEIVIARGGGDEIIV